MTAISTKKSVSIPREKVQRAVRLLLPKGTPFDLHVQKSALGGMKVVRIVTPAWKRLRPAERISRVRDAVENTLSPQEKQNILRFSVLTPDEYKMLFALHQVKIEKRAPDDAKRMVRKPPALKKKLAGAK
jgi:hypothetical protein